MIAHRKPDGVGSFIIFDPRDGRLVEQRQQVTQPRGTGQWALIVEEGSSMSAASPRSQ
jgi:hypothetical protein